MRKNFGMALVIFLTILVGVLLFNVVALEQRVETLEGCMILQFKIDRQLKDDIDRKPDNSGGGRIDPKEEVII